MQSARSLLSHDSSLVYFVRPRCSSRSWVVAVSVLLLPALVVISWVRLLKTPDDTFLHSTSSKNILDASTIQPCSFEELVESFGTVSVSKKRNVTCWSLHDEILRLPANAIVNRNNLTKLGGCCLGGVYKAFVQQNDKSYCSVALKTDNCYPLFTNPFAKSVSCDRSRAVSCLDRRAFWIRRSYLGGEYTGALPWFVSLHRNQSIDGLLPTWGVVISDRLHRMPRHWIPSHIVHDQPLSNDRSVVGVIMPLQEFVDMEKRNPRHLNTTELAELMLPPARALEFLDEIGLSFQDVKHKNIGVGTDGKAFLYDNSKFAVANYTAKFCPEAAFSKALRNNDTPRFRAILLNLLRTAPDSRAGAMGIALKGANGIRQIVQVLVEYAKWQ